MKKFKLLSVLLLAGTLMFTGCGSSSSGGGEQNPPTDNNDPVVSPHPGETVEEAKARYLKDIKATNPDLNTSNPTININLIAMAECIYGKDPSLKRDDIIATFGNGVREEDLNSTTGVDDTCNGVTIRKVGGTFTNSLNVLYYNINNPVTGNEQLLAYNSETKTAHVVNTNVILGNRTFLFQGEKNADSAKYIGRLHGLYLDPNQEFETRTGTSRGRPFVYKFFTDNALMKFDATNPTNVETFFASNQIPSTASFSGLTKLANDYRIFENIVDPDNSYIALKAFESLADDTAGENPDEKLQAEITVRVADKKAILGRPVTIIKDADMKTASILILEAPVFKPSSQNGIYTLKKYDALLNSGQTIASGTFYLASQNQTHVYLYKEGSNKIWALAKDGGTALTEVSGITLAGAYKLSVHGIGAWHGAFTNVINGAASTLSGRNESLGKGADAYLALHYDLHPDAVVNAFGTSGAYKSVQIFKLTGTSGVKLMDNQDGIDHSLDAALDSEKIKGHVNIIVATDDKLYVELGWWDGTDTAVGGTCTDVHSSRGVESRKCTNVKYGYLNVSEVNATDIITLTANGNEIKAMSLPYYVSRRVAPVAVDGKLYISTFNGGDIADGYKFKKYVVDLGSTTANEGAGRVYFIKDGFRNSGEYTGIPLSWDASIAKIINEKSGLELGDTSEISGHKQGSISGQTDGVPLAGIGELGMLKNNDANHAFTMFLVDPENPGIQSVDFAPFGGWIYE